MADTFGDSVLTRLHNDSANQGFAAIQAALDDLAPGMTVDEAVDTWLATMALDGALDDGATLSGDSAAYQVDRLNASINWDTDDTYDTPGAPPNGGDFVRLRDGAGTYLSAGQVTSIAFDGVSDLPSLPITWVVDADPPSQPGDPALSSTNADNRNDVIVRDVSVPTGSPQLTFDAAWDLETTFDFAYAQVTTDHGESYTSLQCTDTVDDTSGDNVGAVTGPGSTGSTTRPRSSPRRATCPRTPVRTSASRSGTSRTRTRTATDSGSTTWRSTGRRSPTAPRSTGGSRGPVNPVEIEGYTVQLVAYDDAHTQAHVFSLPLDGSFDGTIDGTELTDAIGTDADVVAAIVTFHDGTELVTQYAPYTLTVNGVIQPGG
jgi:hypothetical protein